MGFIRVPNLPEGPVSLAVVDGRMSQEAIGTLASLGIKVVRTRRHSGVYEAIAFHPDIMLHHVQDNRIVYAPGTDPELLGELAGCGFVLIGGETCLSQAYPADIAYNVARIGVFYIHNLKYTDPVLKRELEKQGIEPLNVKQGYTKCSVSIVDSKSIITSDKGIAKAAEKAGIEALLVGEGQNISLPGMDNGFIGGCTGLGGDGRWVVNGDARKLTDYSAIWAFLSARKLEVVSLTSGVPVDAGSIIPLQTYM